MITIPVGIDRTPSLSYDVGTEFQRQWVTELVGSDDFEYACSNRFDTPEDKYRGLFFIIYYTKGDHMHMVKLGAKKVLRHIEGWFDENGKQVAVEH